MHIHIASEQFWALTVTQAREQKQAKNTELQEHELIAFLSGRFAGAKRNWTTYEKEVFAIVQTFHSMYYLLVGPQPVHVFTDHLNLLYEFVPFVLRPNTPRHVLFKVHWWVIPLSRFEFFMYYIESVNCIFADILTRWFKGYRAVSVKRIAALYMDIFHHRSTWTS